MREYEEGYPVDANDRYYQGEHPDPDRRNSSNFGFANVKRDAVPGGNKVREDATAYLNERLKVMPYESTEVLFDQRVEFVKIENPDLISVFITNEDTERFESGKTYTVTYNGVSYKCVPVDGDGDGVPDCIGNLVLLGGENTGEPFMVAATPGSNDVLGDYISLQIFSLNADTSATVKIEKSVIHTIDPKFLPGGGGDSRFVVNVTRDEEWKPSFDKTYEEIMEACLAGKEVVLRDGSFVYTLTGYDDDEGYCAFFLPGNQLGNSIGFSVMRIKRDGRWEECGGTVNCTIEWSDTNEPSQPPV